MGKGSRKGGNEVFFSEGEVRWYTLGKKFVFGFVFIVLSAGPVLGIRMIADGGEPLFSPWFDALVVLPVLAVLGPLTAWGVLEFLRSGGKQRVEILEAALILAEADEVFAALPGMATYHVPACLGPRLEGGGALTIVSGEPAASWLKQQGVRVQKGDVERLGFAFRGGAGQGVITLDDFAEHLEPERGALAFDGFMKQNVGEVAFRDIAGPSVGNEGQTTGGA